MSVLKGYSSKSKRSIGSIIEDLFATFQPVRKKQVALDVISHHNVQRIVSDVVEANSTVSSIVATAHQAIVGDVIYFTSGTHNTLEIKVIKVDTNTIYLGEDLDSAPAVGVTFDILRHKYPRVNADGDLNVSITSTGVIAFQKDGVDTTVSEDTITPANSEPLPVKLVGTAGDINITAGDLNIAMDKANDSVATFTGEDVKFIHRHSYSSVNVTTAAYVQLIASTTSAVRRLQIFDSSGQTLVLAIGAVASEVDKLYIVPGGNGGINVQIAAGVRLSVKAISANATLGELTINFIG